MADDPVIAVSVVLAEAREQTVVALHVPPGTTAAGAVQRSGLLESRPDLDPGRLGLAVHGKAVEAGRVLEAGDRVEILRPLPQDPKSRRRELARQGRTMGRGSAGRERP
jgi:hypothetical protein